MEKIKVEQKLKNQIDQNYKLQQLYNQALKESGNDSDSNQLILEKERELKELRVRIFFVKFTLFRIDIVIGGQVRKIGNYRHLKLS